MDLLSKIIIGIVLFIVTSVIAYLFKIRQLYSTSLHLYSTSVLADKGSISELHIYNKGRKVEEDIKLELNPKLKCSLLASNVSDLQITDNNTILLNRLHPKTKASVLLLIDEGEFNPFDMISLSSKECVGKVLPSIMNIPANYGSTAIVVALIFLGFPALMYFGPTAISNTYHIYTDYKYSEIVNKGWENIGGYLSSDLSDSYSKQEFPIRLLSKTNNDKSINLSFEIINKSAIPLKINMFDGLMQEEKSNYHTNFDFYKTTEIKPMSSQKITFKLSKKKNPYIKFSFESGSESIYGIKHTF